MVVIIGFIVIIGILAIVFSDSIASFFNASVQKAEEKKEEIKKKREDRERRIANREAMFSKLFSPIHKIIDEVEERKEREEFSKKIKEKSANNFIRAVESSRHPMDVEQEERRKENEMKASRLLEEAQQRSVNEEINERWNRLNGPLRSLPSIKYDPKEDRLYKYEEFRDRELERGQFKIIGGPFDVETDNGRDIGFRWL